MTCALVAVMSIILMKDVLSMAASITFALKRAYMEKHAIIK